MELTITRFTINKVNLKTMKKLETRAERQKLKYANVGDNSKYKAIGQL